MIDYGTWDKVDGGEIDSGSTAMRSAGIVTPVSLGGPPSISNLVVTRGYRFQRDHQVLQQMIDSVGRSSVTVTIQPLDVALGFISQGWTARGRSVRGRRFSLS